MKKQKKSKKSYSVGHIHWAFTPVIGGVETHLKILLSEMKNYGHKIALLTADSQGRPKKEKIGGIDVYRTPLLNLDLLLEKEAKNGDIDLKKLYLDFIERIKADIIHVHNMHYFSKKHIKVLEKICARKGIPIVLTAHNVWDDGMYLDIVKSVNWSHIIAVSHYIKRELWGIGINENKITAIHHGIDTDIYRPGVRADRILRKYPILKGKRIIFHPARISLAKGCDVSVKAMNIVRRHLKDTVLVLAGSKNIVDWNERQHKDIEYIKELILKLGMEKQVVIDSFDQREMVELYNLSEAALYPSTAQEPFGLTMLESQACGVPIIVTYSGGMIEVIHDKINGFVVPTGDFSQVAYRIMFLLGDTEMRKKMGRTGRDIVRYHYTKEMMVERNIEIYRKVMGEKTDF
ncbi:MAG TPA: glycosyltransferase family 1 protein [Firmicutes bacterium]|nr:glycosyltransferase family 1 protein [Bacillota bacterium]